MVSLRDDRRQSRTHSQPFDSRPPGVWQPLALTSGAPRSGPGWPACPVIALPELWNACRAVPCRADHPLRRPRGCPGVLDVVDVPDPVPGEGQHRYEVSSAGVGFADTHQALS